MKVIIVEGKEKDGNVASGNELKRMVSINIVFLINYAIKCKSMDRY